MKKIMKKLKINKKKQLKKIMKKMKINKKK